MRSVSKIFLRPQRSGSAIGGHPWIFGKWVDLRGAKVEDGAEVEVHAAEGDRFIGHGLYNSQSDLRIRLYSWKKDSELNPEFFHAALASAVELRNSTMGPFRHGTARRLVFSEADQLSGLVVDRFGDDLVVQVTSVALMKRLDWIVESLRNLVNPRGIFLREPSDILKREGLKIEERTLWGEKPETSIEIDEGGVKFGVALRSGQKTGFYLDQAENRQVVGKLGQGREVLDLYCYTGGFGIHAAKAGAAFVVSVDSSEPALQQAKRNAELNGVRQIELIRADVDEYLKSDSKDFDLVIADPPRFATSQSSKEAALRKYFHINTEAMKKVRPGGFFVSCNCSGRVEASEWVSLLAAAATKSGKIFQIIENRGASRDHPVSAHCPETEYLKCVIGRVLNR